MMTTVNCGGDLKEFASSINFGDLRSASAHFRFLSVEPLLEDLGSQDLSGIHWVIVGGESGFGARGMKREWVISVKRQWRAQKVLFFEQWGGVRKSKRGRKLDGRTYDEMPLEQGIPVLHLAKPQDRRLELARTALL